MMSAKIGNKTMPYRSAAGKLRVIYSLVKSVLGKQFPVIPFLNERSVAHDKYMIRFLEIGRASCRERVSFIV